MPDKGRCGQKLHLVLVLRPPLRVTREREATPSIPVDVTWEDTIHSGNRPPAPVAALVSILRHAGQSATRRDMEQGWPGNWPRAELGEALCRVVWLSRPSRKAGTPEPGLWGLQEPAQGAAEG